MDNKFFIKKVILGLVLASALNSSCAYANEASGVFTISATIKSNTCSFDSSNYSLILPDVYGTDLSDGSVKKISELPVTVTCDNEVRNVKIKVSGNPDSTNTTVFANTGSATGIGIYIKNEAGDQLTPSGEHQDLIDINTLTNKGVYNIWAGYYRVGDVSPGSVLSVINLEFNYE